MEVFAGKPFKVTRKYKDGKRRVCWQVKLYSRQQTTGKIAPVSRKTYDTRIEAVDAIPRLIREHEKTDGNISKGSQITFKRLCEIALKTFYAPATFSRKGTKLRGSKTSASKRSQLGILARFFGDYKLANITEFDIDAYLRWREQNGSLRGKEGKALGKPISIAVTNRELASLRRMLNFAQKEGWILQNPLTGSGHISLKAEEARTRLLTRDEEALLLACCEPGEKEVTYQRRKRGQKEKQTLQAVIDTGNAELKTLVLLALDGGLRRREAVRLSWADIDFDAETVTVVLRHSKNEEQRQTLLSPRLADELRKLSSYGKQKSVFSTVDFKRSFGTARKLAGCPDVRLHDLRATCASRMIERGIPLEIVAKILGDRQLVEVVYKHYVRVDQKMLEDVRRRIYADTRTATEVSDSVN